MESIIQMKSLNFFPRLGLWFVCCLAPAVVTCLLFGREGSLGAGLQFSASFILPAWLIFVPLVLKLKDVEDNRIWIILGGGLLLGPFVLAIWCGVAMMRGENPDAVLGGDPLGPSTPALMVLSAFVTLAVAGIYGACLKVLGRLNQRVRVDI